MTAKRRTIRRKPAQGFSPHVMQGIALALAEVASNVVRNLSESNLALARATEALAKRGGQST